MAKLSGQVCHLMDRLLRDAAAGIEAEHEIDRGVDRLRHVGIETGKRGDRDGEEPARNPPRRQAKALEEQPAGRAQTEGDRKSPHGRKRRPREGRHQLPSQARRRRVASARSSALRAKQRRMKSSPPGPKAVPGAMPIFASSTSVSPSLPVSAAPSIVKKR